MWGPTKGAISKRENTKKGKSDVVIGKAKERAAEELSTATGGGERGKKSNDLALGKVQIFRAPRHGGV